MAIEGELSSVTLADICQLLAMGRKTGCLTLTHRSNFGYVYFKGGRVIYATVLNRPDRLGELLVRNDVIERKDLAAAMETQSRQPGKKIGQLLVEAGSLEEEELQRFITMQIEEAVYHLFGWEEGTFHFEPDRAPEAHGGFLVSINTESLLLEGARRVDELSQIEKKIASRDLIFAPDHLPKEGDEIVLTPEQDRLLPLLDGKRTVAELIEESGLGEFDALKGIYGLLHAGFVRSAGRRESGDAPGADVEVGQRLNLGHAFYRAGMLEDAEREYLAVLDADPVERVARARLGIIALRSGRPREAVAHYEAMEKAGLGSDPLAVLLNWGYALELLENFDEALAVLTRAAALAPGDARGPLAIGIVLLKKNEAARAREAFGRSRAALGKGQKPGAVYFAHAVLASAAAGQLEEAIQLGREGLSLHPSSAPLLVNLGAVLEQKGDGGAAEALYLRAVALNPPSPHAHRNLGDLAHARGDQAGARAHFERAVRLDPLLGDDLYLKLGNLAYEEGDRTWARQHWEKALELNPENETIRSNLQLISSTPGA
ncbi:MAG: DUF4388 domain-containing protein [Gemmatimonadota bacterium]